jgi:ParB-like chromosome segregation protein Spo0J
MAKQSAPAGQPVITDEVRKVAELKADPRNARRHSESQISQIAASIEQFGYINRVVIRPGNQIVAGHATLEALKRTGRENVEVRVVAGLTESQYKKLGLALNKLPENSSWDFDILSEILGELDAEGEDLQAIGFSPAEIDKLTTAPDELEVREIETGPVDDEFWISIRGPLAQQAHALKALQEAMKPYVGISVEQGTINLG